MYLLGLRKLKNMSRGLTTLRVSEIPRMLASASAGFNVLAKVEMDSKTESTSHDT